MTWRVCASSAGQRRMRPLHRVPSDLPACPRHLTGSPVGHGRTPAIFPGGPGTNAAGEQRARARAYTTVSMFRGALLRRFLSGANDPRRYCSPIKDEPVISSSPRPPPSPPSASHLPCLAENTSVRESQIIVIILSFAHGWNEEKLRSVDGGETRKQQSG